MGPTAFVLAAVVVLGWFALGTHLNVRRGHRLLGWLQGGLPLVGERTTLRWLASSGLELKVQHARQPLKSAEVFILLEPRDLPVLWWLFRARGRRDLLIIRVELERPPSFEFELLDLRAWSTRAVARALRRDRWTPVDGDYEPPLIAYARGAMENVTRILPAPTLPQLSLVRLAVHATAPHLELQWHLTGLRDLKARHVFATLQRLARLL